METFLVLFASSAWKKMKTAKYVSMSVNVFMCTFAHAQAILPDQPSASGVIKCDAALGN